MGTDLEVVVSNSGTIVIITLIGEAHMDAEDAYSPLERAAAQHPRAVVVDATRLTFMNSMGMHWLLKLRRNVMEAGGKLRIAGLHPMIQTALRHACILEMFELSADLPAALALVSDETSPPPAP